MKEDPLPNVDVEITSQEVRARPRKLNGVWSVLPAEKIEVHYYVPPRWWERLWSWCTRPFRKPESEKLCAGS